MISRLLQKFLTGIDTILPKEETIKMLSSGKTLHIKWGADPSAPDLHLGHMVILNKLRLLQEMGHTVIFLIGDFTARIGDPTGRSETRKPLSQENIMKNSQTYQDQVFKILLKEKTLVKYNSEWLDKMSVSELIQLAGKTTIARMLERNDFSKRFKENSSISLHEFLYPLFQGFDSVVLKDDIEVGGTDQTFNLLLGRQLQEQYEQKPQSVITFPILEGLDGVRKMSKSYNNHIGIMEDPSQIFGKIMSIPDNLIMRYFTLLTDLPVEELKEKEDKLKNNFNPKFLKEELGYLLVTKLYSDVEADKAKVNFQKIFSEKQLPDTMKEIKVNQDKIRLADLIINNQILPSKKEFQRLVQQGAIYLDQEKVTDVFLEFTPQSGQVLKVGKLRFYKLVY